MTGDLREIQTLEETLSDGGSEMRGRQWGQQDGVVERIPAWVPDRHVYKF